MSATDPTVTLTRDCEAVMVPSGTTVTLQKGGQAVITQSLGGTFTVVVNGNMFRIAGKDADAIGRESPATPAQTVSAPSGPVDEKLLWAQMKTCFDPEIPVNVVDLGLIYDCKVSPLPAGGNRVDVKMTLTAAGCPMAGSMAADVKTKLEGVPGVTEVNVDIVWEPPWNQQMMTEAAKLQLGLM
ncbi:MAG: putative Fe-S cluster assembly protein SufT [Verrucomicrobiia bacterium]